jgi:hypothetical protein
MADCCEHDNEPIDSIIGEEFLDFLRELVPRSRMIMSCNSFLFGTCMAEAGPLYFTRLSGNLEK